MKWVKYKEQRKEVYLMKKFLAGILIACALALPLSGFAAPPATSSAPSAGERKSERPKIDYGKLTEQQKKDMVKSMKAVLIARKAAILKMIENKTITKEHGDAMIKRIDERIKYLDQHGLDGMKEHFGHDHSHRKTMDNGAKATE
jgi:hypothetical protein